MSIYNAEWLALPGQEKIRPSGIEKGKPLYLDFVRDFEIGDGVDLDGIVGEVTANSHYLLYVNSERIAHGPTPGSRQLWYFHKHAIPAGILKKGTNRVSIRVFHEGYDFPSISEFDVGEPGMLFSLSSSNEILCRSSEDGWKVRISPEYSTVGSRLSEWNGYKEFYHGDKKDNWMSAGDEIGPEWKDAFSRGPAVNSRYAVNLEEYKLPDLERRVIKQNLVSDFSRRGSWFFDVDGKVVVSAEGLKLPVRVEQQVYGASPELVFDFEKEVVGRPEIKISGDEAIVEVWYGESLDCYRTDVVKFHGSVREWKAYHRRAFRFIKLVIIQQSGPICIESVAHHNEMYSFPATEYRGVEDDFLKQIIDVSDYTLRISSSQHFEGCPLREPDLWTFDARIMALMSMYLYEEDPLGRKSIEQLFALQNPQGRVPCVGPRENGQYLPDFQLHLCIMLHEQYLFNGDLEFIKRWYPSAKLADTYIRRYFTGEFINLTSQETPFFDWGVGIERLGRTSFIQALYVQHLEAMAAMAELCGEASDAELFGGHVKTLRTRTHEVFFEAEKGLYREVHPSEGEFSASFQSNMMLCAAGIPDQELGRSILEKLLEPDAYVLPYGPSFYLIVFEALERYGMGDRVPEVLNRYWKPMLDRDAKTWWEVFDPNTSDDIYPHPFLGNTPTLEMDWIPVSHVHAWSGVAVIGIHRSMMGIVFDGKGGFRKARKEFRK
ncbi:MGH1-like glycoside hydrolase domain-containing protein [Pelagicoccus mobilis]|uniref:Alpha-L-rhamnosidase six-hairpin glycosidase domain-containing protein n=1 Tax=Pelagicoccus mobilis TaxID=415221 RepID=A0A934VPM0_9BACT|nr:hypothetical protein [Pelagicoccus mobilis]MBK1877432.1 hypothetical protein [Pelagicoccus mobilis]